jgi:hypothetical protein
LDRRPDPKSRESTKWCVILGKVEEDSPEARGHYVLLISEHPMDMHRTQFFERIGVGYLPGGCILPGGYDIKIR